MTDDLPATAAYEYHHLLRHPPNHAPSASEYRLHIGRADAAIDELLARVAELEFIVGEMPTYFVEEARRRWHETHPDAEVGTPKSVLRRRALQHPDAEDQ